MRSQVTQLIRRLGVVAQSMCIACWVLTGQTLAQSGPRKDTVIFDLAKTIQDPKNFNWYTRGTKREHGAHQAMWEPLFFLNYDTGQIDPWLALSLIPKDPAKPEEWNLTLRRGVTWSDGKPFTADDVAFTVNELVLKNDSLVAQEAVTIRQQVASATRDPSDNLKLTFKLKYPNPRFAVENFASGFFGSFLIMPRHIWKDALYSSVAKEQTKDQDRDPTKFSFYPPLGTGPYKLKDASQTKMVWERDSNWWATKVPLPFKKSFPVPLQLEWHVLGSDAQSKTALEQGDIDAGREMTLAALRDAQSKNNKIISWDSTSPLAWNDPCARQLDVNSSAKLLSGLENHWSDARLRRAISMLVDRKALASTVYADTTTPSRTLFPEYGGLKAAIDAVVNAGYGIDRAPMPRPPRRCSLRPAGPRAERFTRRAASASRLR